MKRRRFLKTILAFLGSITFFSFAYSLLKFLAALPAKTAEAKKLVIRKSDVPSGEARNIICRNAPAIVLNRPEKGFVAFSRVCTHLGCLVDYNKRKQLFLCPCHAGVFDLEGNVVSGPPPKSMAVIPLRIEGENIVIG
ncbi:MAG: ubiquinol-cytochrome c reductase iron-sulfur subunit [Nitrospirota bacterium]